MLIGLFLAYLVVALIIWCAIQYTDVPGTVGGPILIAFGWPLLAMALPGVALLMIAMEHEERAAQ